MKEHGSESLGEAPTAKALKSLLKKPGQTKPKSQKNRVMINEKLNEFFAADYIILIKEECCADYEEECDCCCQEHEMIRLGNCKECRAELNLHFDGRQVDGEGDGDGGEGRGEQVHGVDDPRVENERGSQDCKGGGNPPRVKQQQPHHQQETLSPPEGYKDVCEENEAEEDGKHNHHHHHPPVCAECNYYHQRATEQEEQPSGDGTIEHFKNTSSERTQNADPESMQDTTDQAQQTTPDLHQRYLVETITMTTVTERRIVREVSEDDPAPSIDETDNANRQSLEIRKNCKISGNVHSSLHLKDENSITFENSMKSESADIGSKSVGKTFGGSDHGGKETHDATELSLTLKLGNVSLISNSLKPNSAVRQLFPDPRFISPPPAPAKVVPSGATNDTQDNNNPESQNFLITTESLRLFDAVKRSNLAGAQCDSEGEPTTIKKTIERNALRRSLICKYEPNSKKKNLRSKEFTLEERIRQLTCLDLDDQDTESSASENATTYDGSDYLEFPIRTSPSGEEAKNDTTPHATSTIQDHHPTNGSGQANTQQSTYKKITDLFGQKRIDSICDSTKALPDLGIGNKLQGKDYPTKIPVTKMNSDARKQFLASLTPLSCVAATAIDSREDYYQLSSKITTTSNRDSIGYNSDSSYSLEDIEAALRGEEKNFKNAGGPPDVTQGTPTSAAGDDDSAADELLAFVEQDKSRTERIRKRYNDAEEHQHYHEDEDDELNDYGFNRRPSVRGIKPKFGSTNEIIRQLQSRHVTPNSIIEAKIGSHISWPYYDNEGDKRSIAEDNDDTYQMINESRESNTINRINTMQKQIDDIYQTIAETAASVQGTLKRGSYLESTLPRPVMRAPIGDDCHRYNDHKNGVRPSDQQQAGARMLRIAGGGDGGSSGIYNTLPTKPRRLPAQALPNHPCSVVPSTDAKCYRTMYFVPYNGITDPTYQNIQRILPPHASPNYANHVERYPYPRNERSDQQPGYYARSIAATVPSSHSQSALHLHLQQPDEFRVPNTMPLHGVHPLQQVQQQQSSLYNVQSIPYPVTTPMRGAAFGNGYSYQVQLGRCAADVQTQTISLPPSSTPVSLSAYHNVTQVSTATTTALSSPTKLQQQQRASCTAAERGVPEGAASVPSHDFPSNPPPAHVPNFLSHPSNVPPPNTQNSVYYAMNV